MLREIHIRNYAVVENLNVEFFPGLNVLSGETGSGKSILIGALGLVFGGRASADIVRTGADRAVVTAVFEASDHAPWAAWLEEYGMEGREDHELFLRREVSAEGKSRLLVNDQPASLAAARDLARRLADLHGQNEHVALLARGAQLEILDQFTGSEALLGQVAELYGRRQHLERQTSEIAQSEQDRLRTIDLLRFQVQELHQARLEPGEDAKLQEERSRLLNVEKLRASAGTAFATLYDDEGSACARLAAAARSLEDLRRYEIAAEPHLESLASARAGLEDVAAYLRDYLERLEADPQRLEQVEDRLAQIARLKRKYGKTIEEILAYGAQSEQQLGHLEQADARRQELAVEFEKAAAEYTRVARDLSERRKAAARALEKNVRQELAHLGMEKARFEVHFLGGQQVAGGPRGADEIEMRMSANPGEDVRPLERTASGGELSRLMLALKTVVAERAEPAAARVLQKPFVRTFIFDEVDAGIGGRVAERVGQRLKRLSSGAQVLCITHLPQIACFADHHFCVEKIERGGRTLAEVRRLAGQKERAAELARMLSGSQITGAVLKHATEMLKQAAS
ncbi:MAG: DNA repair protein RecN [Terriglobia bacterium]